MKKLVCLMLGIMLMVIAAGAAIAVETESDVPDTDGATTETAPESLPQNVQNQLDIAIMALELANTTTTDATVPVDETAVVEGEQEEEEAVNPEKMEELAERHAFIAWAHYNHVPASRKLQEEVFSKTVEVQKTVTETVTREVLNEDGTVVTDEEGNPVFETVEIESVVTETTSLWDQVKGQLKTTEIDYTGILDGITASNPELQGLINGDINWGQYKKAPKMTTLKAQTALKASRGKALGKDKDKEDHGSKGEDNGNKGGNGGGNAGGNGGGNGKDK